MDVFAERYPMYKLTHEKGELLAGFVREAKPKVRINYNDSNAGRIPPLLPQSSSVQNALSQAHLFFAAGD